VVVMAIQGGACIELLNHARQKFDPNLLKKVTLKATTSYNNLSADARASQ